MKKQLSATSVFLCLSISIYAQSEIPNSVSRKMNKSMEELEHSKILLVPELDVVDGDRPVSISLDEARAMPTRTINMAFDIYRVKFLGFKTSSLAPYRLDYRAQEYFKFKITEDISVYSGYRYEFDPRLLRWRYVLHTVGIGTSMFGDPEQRMKDRAKRKFREFRYSDYLLEK